jgi:hypothetical protein
VPGWAVKEDNFMLWGSVDDAWLAAFASVCPQEKAGQSGALIR